MLKINFTLVLLALTLAGCAQIKFSLNTGKLPIETASEIQKEIGEDFNFGHVVIIDDRTAKSLLLTRSEREEGSLLYETKPITMPLTVKKVKEISSHSVLVTEINEKNDTNAPPLCLNIGNSVCNLITINNETNMLCNKDEEIFSKGKNFSTEYDHISQETSTIVFSAPSQLFKKLEALGKGKVNSIGFLILNDIKTGEPIIVKDENYKFVKNDFLDCPQSLTGKYETNTFFAEGSCRSGQSDGGGDGSTTRTRRC